MYTYMFTHPGAKLLFMGNEFAATNEWNYKSELQWDLLNLVSHGGMKYCVKKLNELYRQEPALYEKQFEPGGFEWVDLNHRSEGVMSYKRKGLKPEDDVVIILNVTPVVRHDWEIHVYGKEKWAEIFNSNSKDFWGSGDVYNPNIPVERVHPEDNWYQLKVQLPALGAVVLK
jgi:1,4-alpha-glucan branching enzyme